MMGDLSNDVVAVVPEVFDLLHVGLVFYDTTGRLLLANRTARRLLYPDDRLKPETRGGLRNSANNRGLSSVIRAAIESRLHEMDPAIDTAMVVHHRPGRSAVTMFLPGPCSFSDPAGGVLAVPVVVWEQREQCDVRPSLLCRIWGLTPAEGRFAVLLMQGLTLVDCSERLGVCRATGAFHLKNLFRKTGTQRQIELLSVLFRSVGWGIGGRNAPAESEKRPAGQREELKASQSAGFQRMAT